MQFIRGFQLHAIEWNFTWYSTSFGHI